MKSDSSTTTTDGLLLVPDGKRPRRKAPPRPVLVFEKKPPQKSGPVNRFPISYAVTMEDLMQERLLRKAAQAAVTSWKEKRRQIEGLIASGAAVEPGPIHVELRTRTLRRGRHTRENKVLHVGL